MESKTLGNSCLLLLFTSVRRSSFLQSDTRLDIRRAKVPVNAACSGPFTLRSTTCIWLREQIFDAEKKQIICYIATDFIICLMTIPTCRKGQNHENIRG